MIAKIEDAALASIHHHPDYKKFTLVGAIANKVLKLEIGETVKISFAKDYTGRNVGLKNIRSALAVICNATNINVATRRYLSGGCSITRLE